MVCDPKSYLRSILFHTQPNIMPWGRTYLEQTNGPILKFIVLKILFGTFRPSLNCALISDVLPKVEYQVPMPFAENKTGILE